MRRVLSRSSSTEKLSPFDRLFTVAHGQHGSSRALLPPIFIDMEQIVARDKKRTDEVVAH